MQLDLFAAAGVRHDDPRAFLPARREPPPATEFTDAALIAAIPDASLGTCRALCGEAARRKLTAAVPALEALCRRFVGFGLHHAIPEQTAALQALAAIGGADAMAAVRRIVVGEVIAGPGQRDALRAADSLRCILPEPAAAALLLHADPEVRAHATNCAPRTPQIALLLNNLLEDLNQRVATAAAKALGRMGRPEARPWLERLLRQSADAELIEAVTPVANEDCVVLLGRVARQHPALRDAASAALEAIDTPRATAILAALGNQSAPRREG